MSVRVQREDFDLGAELTALRAGRSDIGALVSFTGLVRDGGGLEALELEHYPGMTEKALAAIEAEARERWPLQALPDGAPIRAHAARRADHDGRDGVGAPRGEAFAAAEFLMDYLKSRAPFWKKETGRDGARWVAAREADEAALGRWGDEKDPPATTW